MNDEPSLEERVQISRSAESVPAVMDRLVAGLEKWLRFTSRHWLAALNLLLLTYVGLPVLAPVLVHAGVEGPANLIYTIYRPACHQLPERSYFLYSNRWTYTRSELPATGPAASDNLFERRTYIGDSAHGYKTAICQRDMAIYGSMLWGGLFFAFSRRRLAALPLKLYALLLVPLAVDGLTQLVGLRESTWLARTFTGILFGYGTALVVFPYLSGVMTEVKNQLDPSS